MRAAGVRRLLSFVRCSASAAHLCRVGECDAQSKSLPPPPPHDDDASLQANNGYMLLGERVRRVAERTVVRQALELVRTPTRYRRRRR